MIKQHRQTRTHTQDIQTHTRCVLACVLACRSFQTVSVCSLPQQRTRHEHVLCTVDGLASPEGPASLSAGCFRCLRRCCRGQLPPRIAARGRSRAAIVQQQQRQPALGAVARIVDGVGRAPGKQETHHINTYFLFLFFLISFFCLFP